MARFHWPAWASLAHAMRTKVFFACFLSALLAGIIATAVTYNASAKVILRNASQQAAAVTANAVDRLDSYAAEIENLARSMASDKETVQRLLTEGSVPVEAQWFDEWKLTKQYLDRMAASQQAIQQIDLIGEANVYSTASTLVLAEARQQLPPTVFQEAGWYFSPGSKQPLAYLRPVYISGKARVGVVRISFALQVLSAIFPPELYPEGQLFLLVSNGAFLTSGPQGETAISHTAYQEAWAAANEATVRVEGKPYQVIRQVSAQTGLVVLALVDSALLMKDALQVQQFILLMLSVMLPLALAASWLVSYRLLKNLHNLQGAMQQVERGNLALPPEIPGRDEVAQLSKGFRSMMEQIQRLFHQVSEQERQRHAAELRALQAQIGPHFVCNTLSNIKYLAALQDAPNIEELAEALAEMMRMLLGNLSEDVTVAQEVAMLHSYVLIQKYRVYDRIQVHFEVAPTAAQALLPRMLLQPVMENAYLHGLAEAPSGQITLRIFPQGEQLICEVEDNGAGMTPEKQRLLAQKSQGVPERSAMSGLGLANVRQRLAMRWPQASALEIHSRYGQGTLIRLRLPLVKGAPAAPHGLLMEEAHGDEHSVTG